MPSYLRGRILSNQLDSLQDVLVSRKLKKSNGVVELRSQPFLEASSLAFLVSIRFRPLNYASNLSHVKLTNTTSENDIGYRGRVVVANQRAKVLVDGITDGTVGRPTNGHLGLVVATTTLPPRHFQVR
ncbi:hypothetical protein FNV43_RR11089 [Rhamnella rubrinervis]|uniref:Uncharacterized protein n=1 Tax=Rhamnella rubrinervis TaxID=2594499 RepID=A0A8K0MHE5_9ROSA|nr:hypothetical protein FNV43_RR11089 [Rhamnella rubrinervis]